MLDIVLVTENEVKEAKSHANDTKPVFVVLTTPFRGVINA